MILRSISADYLADVAHQALAALRDNRLRTVLSIVGIAIGIMAVVAIGTVSKGGRYVIFSELETFGLKSVWVFRDYQDSDPRRSIRAGTGIDNGDYAGLGADCCTAVRQVTPVIRGRGQRRMPVKAGNRYAKASVHGTAASYFAINNDVFASGRGLRPEDDARRRRVAVIASDVKRDLFGADGEAVGRDIRIGGEKFLVVGVLAEKNRGFLASIGSSGGESANDRVVIPYLTYQQMLGTKDIDYLQAEAVSLEQANTAVAEIIGVLSRRHKGQYVYRSETMAQYIETANRILRGVSLIGVIAASVSLLVGGMAIMNIMSTSVLERTREIGLRKAVGATRGDVLLQFLAEAVLISVSGGALGLALALAASFALAAVTGFPLTPSWATIVVSLTVSVAVGLVSGFYPAYRAASLRPVVALRYE